MKNLIDKIVRFVIPAKDKLQHYYLWSLIFFALVFAFDAINYVFPQVTISDWWAYGLTVLSAADKEIRHDLILKKGHPSLKDFIFGILMASLFMLNSML
jgi:hypothetical protein